MQRLYDKYVPTLVDMVVEGIIDGRQGEKMKTIVPLTNLNMVGFFQIKHFLSSGPEAAIGSRSDCRSRSHEFDPGHNPILAWRLIVK